MDSEKLNEELAVLDISKEFLERLLGKQLESFAIEAGSNPGDNYLSIMHAVKINIKNEENPLHILIKCVPNHPTRREFIEESDVFRKEFFIYDYWIPKLEKMQEEIGVTPKLKLPFPPYLGGHVTNPVTPNGAVNNNDTKLAKSNIDGVQEIEHNYIVMMDMRKLEGGFRMADRMEGADYDHCKLVVDELAKIHAFTWAYKQRNGVAKLTSLYPSMIDTMLTGENAEQFRPLMQQVLKTALDSIEKGLGSDSPAYIGASRLRTVDIPDEICSLIRMEGADEAGIEAKLRIKPEYDPNYNTEPWLLGCHGDCWLNNMLFKYDEKTGKPKKVILVDLQLYREGCPTSDLVYFFYSSTTSKTRRNHEESLMKLYHDKFLEYCSALQCEPLPGFSLSSLKRRYHRSKIVGFPWSLPLLTFVLKEPEKVVNLDSIDKNQNMSDLFSNVTEGSGENSVLTTRLCEMAQELYEAGVL